VGTVGTRHTNTELLSGACSGGSTFSTQRPPDADSHQWDRQSPRPRKPPVSTAPMQTNVRIRSEPGHTRRPMIRLRLRDTWPPHGPLLLLQHFRGTRQLGSCARSRPRVPSRVIAFDNIGCPAGQRTTPNPSNKWLQTPSHSRMRLRSTESTSSASRSALRRAESHGVGPRRVRNLILASAARRGAAGMHGWHRG